jgi:hypothetical protein
VVGSALGKGGVTGYIFCSGSGSASEKTSEASTAFTDFLLLLIGLSSEALPDGSEVLAEAEGFLLLELSLPSPSDRFPPREEEVPLLRTGLVRPLPLETAVRLDAMLKAAVAVAVPCGSEGVLEAARGVLGSFEEVIACSGPLHASSILECLCVLTLC